MTAIPFSTGAAFRWDAADNNRAQAITAALETSGVARLAGYIVNVARELSAGRSPLVADAWGFFDARRRLPQDETLLCAWAESFGRRLVLAAYPAIHDIVDVRLIRAGASAAPRKYAGIRNEWAFVSGDRAGDVVVVEGADPFVAKWGALLGDVRAVHAPASWICRCDPKTGNNRYCVVHGGSRNGRRS